MTIHEIHSQLAPSEVIERARHFFAHAGGPGAAFTEEAGSSHLKLHMEVGEIVIGALQNGESTLVRGSASRGEALLTRFLAALAQPSLARETIHRRGLTRARGAAMENSPSETSFAEDGSSPQPARAA